MKANPCLNFVYGRDCNRFSKPALERINDHYWGLSAIRIKVWVLYGIKPKPISRRRAPAKHIKRRNRSFEYSLVNERITFAVCKKCIMETLNISQMTIRYTLKQRSSDNQKKIPQNKTDAKKLYYFNHI